MQYYTILQESKRMKDGCKHCLRFLQLLEGILGEEGKGEDQD